MKIAEEIQSPDTSIYQRTVANTLARVVGQSLQSQIAPRVSSNPSITRRHRLAVFNARQQAMLLGINDNSVVGEALSLHGIPHANGNVVGLITVSNHPALAKALNSFNRSAGKKIDLNEPSERLAYDRFCRSTDQLTPDASDVERRAIILGALARKGQNAQVTTILTDEAFPIIELQGREYPVPLTPNPPELEALQWLSPYVSVDFSDTSGYSIR